MPIYNITMDKRISPAITFDTANSSFKMNALYIKAFDELFTELQVEEEKITILTSLNYYLNANSSLIYYLDCPANKKDFYLKEIRTYLGLDSILEQRLSFQLNNYNGRHEFLAACHEHSIETVYIGGVFGKACVWDCARGLADNIYSKQLGDVHPNIRFKDSIEDHRFTNAVIFDELCEGYLESDITFNDFVCFKPTRTFTIKLKKNTDIATQCEQEYPGHVGESYQAFSSADEESKDAHYLLHNRIQSIIAAHQLMDLRYSFISAPKPIEEVSNSSSALSADTQMSCGD